MFCIHRIAKLLAQRSPHGRRSRRPCTRPALEMLETRLVPSGNAYMQTNLVSNVPGMAQITDPSLKNPWGVSESSTSAFWVSDQGTSVSTLYTQTPTGVHKLGLTVTIPKTAAGPQGPTGQVHNGTTDFTLANSKPAAFIFADLNGEISAWNSGTNAQVMATTSGAIYTGLAIGSTSTGNFLYAADGAQNRIDVFNGTFTPVSLPTGAFVDPLLPANLVPFGIQNIGGDIYVAYAPAGRAAQTGAVEGQGAVAIFNASGVFQKQLIEGSKLASPWGMTLAPASFGKFGGDLLVGNFAYSVSEINAFNPTTGEYEGTLRDSAGAKITNQATWALTFGNGGAGGDVNTLYFTAGINGEKDGLFGSIQPIPTLPRHTDLLSAISALPTSDHQTFSTVPANGDLNPYGVAFVPAGFPTGATLQPGDLLVSNFNNSSNVQGTGSTIVRFTAEGGKSVFFQAQTNLGLTTALGVLKSGFVIVGSVPTDANGVAQQGSLLILDGNGKEVGTPLTDSKLLDGPWDLTVNDHGDTAQVFVSNVLSGTVTRIDLAIPDGGTPTVVSETQIASGYTIRTDPNALVVGPTGLAYDPHSETLFVASTGDNAIFAIHDANETQRDRGTGKLIYKDDAHLHGPLGLVLLPNGNLVAANGDAVNPDSTQSNELVEFTRNGKFVSQFQLDSGGPGGAFGLAVTQVDGQLHFAAVNDNTNTVEVWTFETAHHRHHHHHHHHHHDHDD